MKCEGVRPPPGGLKLHIKTINAASSAFPKSLEQYGLYVASMTQQGDSETVAGRHRCRHGHRSDGGRLRLESRVQHINPMCVYNDGGRGGPPLSDYSCEDVRASQWRRRWQWRSHWRQEVGPHVGGGTKLLLTSLACYNTLQVCSTGSYWLWPNIQSAFGHKCINNLIEN